MKKKKLGEVLQARGHISPGDLAQAVSEQQGKVIRLGELLLGKGLVDKAELISAVEEVARVRYVDCGTVTPEFEILNLIPRAMAARCCVLPLGLEGPSLILAMCEPQNLNVSEEVRFKTGKNISPRLAFRQEILDAIDKHYGEEDPSESADGSLGFETDPEDRGQSDQMEFISTSSRQANREAMREIQAELLHKRTPAVRIVSEVIMEASRKLASDIHIEPQATDLLVRIRVDGVLRDLRRVPGAIQNALVSRIKILADMDIAERRTPQDGRFLVRMGNKRVDLRVSSLPTQYGEKIVMRILDSTAAVSDLAQLDMPAAIEVSVRETLSLPQGMLLVTGPTGSGKTTTLYAALNFVRRPSVNIVTVEDPIEYVLPGINQVHVNNKAGLTFANSLRSILRQDPNVIMVGEMRDKETAEIGMKAAQTGHLLLSSLHTNDSVSAVARLLDLGIPGYLIASSITAILAQRLVRRLCECRREIPCTIEAADRLASMGITEPVASISIPVGCDECGQTGYRGRVGVYELLNFNDPIRDSIRGGIKGDDIRNLAREIGMKPMQDDALQKILTGITSIEEVMRVVPIQTITSSVCLACDREISRSFKFCPHCGTQQHELKPRASERKLRNTFEEVKKR